MVGVKLVGITLLVLLKADNTLLSFINFRNISTGVADLDPDRPKVIKQYEKSLRAG
jgi:hypothetical protein